MKYFSGSLWCFNPSVHSVEIPVSISPQPEEFLPLAVQDATPEPPQEKAVEKVSEHALPPTVTSVFDDLESMFDDFSKELDSYLTWIKHFWGINQFVVVENQVLSEDSSWPSSSDTDKIKETRKKYLLIALTNVLKVCFFKSISSTSVCFLWKFDKCQEVELWPK